MACMACMAQGREGPRRLAKSRPPTRCSCLRLALGLGLVPVVPVWCVCVSWSACSGAGVGWGGVGCTWHSENQGRDRTEPKSGAASAEEWGSVDGGV
jgi:hypothetical protein